jgi:hypothetical protein
MRVPLLVALLAACGPGLAGQDAYRNPRIQDFGAELTQASQQHDVKRVRALLRDSVTIGGLWFADVECAKRFNVAREIKGPALDDLARCLAMLELAPSPRADALPDVVVLTYKPGIEVEARFVDTIDGPWLAWIGYVARRDLGDALPTISGSALEALRVEGDSQAPLAGPGAFDELTTLGAAFAWLKICVDVTGAVTGAHVREASSPRAARVFGAAAQTWKFRPFMLGTQPAPVCAMLRMFYPADAAPEREMLPYPLPDTAATNIPAVIMSKMRTGGTILLSPDDRDKVRIQKSKVRKLIGAVHYCTDETGHVVYARTVRASGLPAYDQKLVAGVSKWTFQPFVDDGKPVGVCSAVDFVYTQN